MHNSVSYEGMGPYLERTVQNAALYESLGM
jgi:hypothetical protein